MKISSSILASLLVGSCLYTKQNVEAFSVPLHVSSSSSYRTDSSTTILHATVEKTVLKPPSDIPDDDIAGMFEKYVQKTYGYVFTYMLWHSAS